ncbi:type I phosphomannose isomerase catalytic subunit, partial [Cellulomonas triticagri]
MLRLANPVRHYPWGSTDALPGLLGLPPDGRPCAEIWVGAHPAAPSVVLDPPGRDGAPGTAAPLDVLVREHAPGLLGARVRDRFGDRLPYLVKLLAAVRPLSLQVHPGAERARRRHAEEVAAGVPAAERRYPDPWHKPELLVALAPTLALAGLREPDEAADLLERLPAHGGEALVDVVAALRAPGPAEDRLRRGLRRV